MTATPDRPEGIVGTFDEAAVNSILLDSDNPRFPAAASDDQASIAKVMADQYDAIEIARKVASEGYHVAEPPAVVRLDGGAFLVLEGNRRVTALKGLLEPELRKTFAQAREWESLADKAAHVIPATIPVVVYPNRDAARSLLGHRHIRGNLQWDAPQQAKYVRRLVDSGLTFKEAADICSKRVGEVREMYRNSRLIHDDAPALGIDTEAISRRFSVFGLAMSNKTLREHAAVLPSSEVQPGGTTLQDPRGSNSNLRELIGWIAGDHPVLEDSRKVVKLAQVVSNPVGLRTLREGKSLDQALQAVSDLGAKPLENAERMLAAATNSMTNAAGQIDLLEISEKAQITARWQKLRAALLRVEEALEGSHDGVGD